MKKSSGILLDDLVWSELFLFNDWTRILGKTLKYYNGSTFGFKRAGQIMPVLQVPFTDTSVYLKKTNRDLH